MAHSQLLGFLSAALLGVVANAEVAQPPVRSTRGVQHKDPLISDDFIVGCIMIMFLLLFCFGQLDAIFGGTLCYRRDWRCRKGMFNDMNCESA
ncbi:hypothetical protein AB1Y20_003973 [Prymnesium parvum]|uniref:Uncharacterized protein n=1 Tax=Prymnesium parvum TaxID=97485 RepID=A0AB34J8L0_PRYPA